MPTISQLPVLSSVDPADEMPISHGGITESVSVGTLLSGMQPAVLAPSGALLGRVSLGSGGPEPIGVGVGLGLEASVLIATGADHGAFPSQALLEPSDQAVLSSGGAPKLLELSLLRGLFFAGSNIAIDSAGTISAAMSAIPGNGSGTSYNITSLPVVADISAPDLVGISQGGTASAIAYQNLLNGLSIDEAQPALAASDSDTLWVAQASDTMVGQTFSAIWAWIVTNQPRYKFPIVEVVTNTVLDATAHNGRILVCSQPITLTPAFANMGAGFFCSVINLSGASVTLSTGIVSSSGISALSTGGSCTMQGVTYSGGSVVYASMSGGAAEVIKAIPGAVTGLVITGVSSNGVSLGWMVPASGGAVTSYSVQYQVAGAPGWTMANSAVIGTSYSISGLDASTAYEFEVFATNSAGAGPVSGAAAGSTSAAGGVLPSQVTSVTIDASTSSTLSLIWSAPTVGTAPISYTVNYRPTGTTVWTTYTSGLSSTSSTVTGLSASTSYDFELIATNSLGNGMPSTAISQSTIAAGISVTAVTWNVPPSGSYTHGSGSIGVNVQVAPANAPVQFGFATSQTTPPSDWTPGAYVNSDLWGAYVDTPVTAGTWYAWVEGTNASLPTVYPTPFAVI